MKSKQFSFISKALAVFLCVITIAGCVDKKDASLFEIPEGKSSIEDIADVSADDSTQNNSTENKELVEPDQSSSDLPENSPIINGENGKEDEALVNGKNILDLDDSEIIDLAKNADKIPDGYIDIAGERLQFIVDSAADEDDALDNAQDRVHDERFADSRNVPTGAVVIAENDLYYLINVSWDYITEVRTTSYTGKTLCFKKQFVDFTAAIYYRGVEFSMTVKDHSKIKAYLDLYEYYQISEISGQKILLTTVNETEGGYEYNAYLLKTVYGDFIMKDSVSIVKKTYLISANGSVTYSGQQNLRTAYGDVN